MQNITLTSKGQITLPAYVRRHFGLEQGDQLVCTLEGSVIQLLPPRGHVEAGSESVRESTGTSVLASHHRVVDDDDVSML